MSCRQPALGRRTALGNLRWSIACCAILSGCGPDGPELAPIHGSITQAGGPIAEARIVLHPLSAVPESLPQPQATTDANGQFDVTTLEQGDGALPGKYAVTVQLRAPRRHGEETIRDGKNLLPPRYANPQTSGIVREVHPGENNWAAIELDPK